MNYGACGFPPGMDGTGRREPAPHRSAGRGRPDGRYGTHYAAIGCGAAPGPSVALSCDCGHRGESCRAAYCAMRDPMTLRILLLEDVPEDAALVERHLTKSGLEFVSQRVDTRVHFEEALQNFVPDIILSDHGLPGFDGSAALALVKQRSPTLPVILVTGSLNEEKAVEFMKAGAADYILKDHLTRLPAAIRRALRALALREAREQAVAALQAPGGQDRPVVQRPPHPLWVFDLGDHPRHPV